MPQMSLTVNPIEGGSEPYSIRVRGWEEVAASLKRECIKALAPNTAEGSAEEGLTVTTVRIGGVEVKSLSATWEQLGVDSGLRIEVGVAASAAGKAGQTAGSPCEALVRAVQEHMRYTRQEGGGLNPGRYDRSAAKSLFPRCAAEGGFHPGQCHGVDGTGYLKAWWTCCQEEGDAVGVDIPGCCAQGGYGGALGEAAHGWKGGSGAHPRRSTKWLP